MFGQPGASPLPVPPSPEHAAIAAPPMPTAPPQAAFPSTDPNAIAAMIAQMFSQVASADTQKLQAEQQANPIMQAVLAYMGGTGAQDSGLGFSEAGGSMPPEPGRMSMPADQLPGY